MNHSQSTFQCPNIIGSYHKTVAAGAAFDVLVTVCIFAFSIFTCISCCCPQNFGGDIATAGGAAPVPVQATAQVNATAVPVNIDGKLYLARVELHPMH
jgi:uncharacterized protein (DUF111 family)